MTVPYSQPKHPFGEIVVTAPSALSSGQPFACPDGSTAVYVGLKPAAAGDKVAARYAGIKSIDSASATTFAAGATVYWNTVTLLAVAAADAPDTIVAGTAAVAKVSGDLAVETKLNGGSL